MDSNLDSSGINGSSNLNQKPTDFEAIIEEIDKDLFEGQLNSNPIVAEIVHEIKGSSLRREGREELVDLLERVAGHLNEQVNHFPENFDGDVGNAWFSIGWAETKEKCKGAKSGKGKKIQKGEVKKVNQQMGP